MMILIKNYKKTHFALEIECNLLLRSVRAFQNKNSEQSLGLNISTGHRTMTDKKPSCVRRNLLHNGHSYAV